ncbi:hypothetical protein SESBI_11255 [Sesbania bispinosa]|nr:hypothetical protein SESBI_11255 [Sesbania bispinosa]
MDCDPSAAALEDDSWKFPRSFGLMAWKTSRHSAPITGPASTRRLMAFPSGFLRTTRIASPASELSTTTGFLERPALPSPASELSTTTGFLERPLPSPASELSTTTGFLERPALSSPASELSTTATVLELSTGGEEARFGKNQTAALGRRRQ